MTPPHDRPSLKKTATTKIDSRIPSRLDLFNALENILWFWPELFIQSAEITETQRSQMILTRSVRLTGTHEGTVTFQATPELGALMAQNLLQIENADAHAADAFTEFVNMFCGHMMNRIRDTTKASFRHFLPLEVPKSEWPASSPDSTLMVGVGAHLLQIDLWLSRPEAVEGKDPA